MVSQNVSFLRQLASARDCRAKDSCLLFGYDSVSVEHFEQLQPTVTFWHSDASALFRPLYTGHEPLVRV